MGLLAVKDLSYLVPFCVLSTILCACADTFSAYCFHLFKNFPLKRAWISDDEKNVDRSSVIMSVLKRARIPRWREEHRLFPVINV